MNMCYQQCQQGKVLPPFPLVKKYQCLPFRMTVWFWSIYALVSSNPWKYTNTKHQLQYKTQANTIDSSSRTSKP